MFPKFLNRVGGACYAGAMNKFDESFFCPFCHERFEFCGCPNDEVDFADSSAVCAVCDHIVGGLFYLNGDPTGRCAHCHNIERSSTFTDWYGW